MKIRNHTTLVLLFSILIFSLFCCQNRNKGIKSSLPDSTLYTQIDYTRLTLDSTLVADFLENYSVSDSTKEQVLQFYIRRDYQYAWFNELGMSSAATLFYDQLQNFKLDFDNNTLENKFLDSLYNQYIADTAGLTDKLKDREKLELLLTGTFFQYADQAWSGTDLNPLDLEWFIPRKKKDFQLVLDSLVSKNSENVFQEPVNQYYIHLKQKLSEYRRIQKNGGFPRVITNKTNLKTGDKDSCLIQVKQYLLISGDLIISDSSPNFTDTLVTALKNFQERMGLFIDGELGKQTLTSLNTSIETRINQIMINLERLRWIPAKMEPDYLLVNIPEFRLHIFEKNKEAWSCNVVVGKSATKTSIFKGNLANVVLNPYWNIPTSIAVNEVLPKLKRNPGYLDRNNMEALSGNSVINPYSVNWNSFSGRLPYTFRQKPGKSNALGKVKFLFPNSYSIYLHDTPSKSLFTQSSRAFSHGCIRVSEPIRLAEYLLRNNSDWSPEKIQETLKTDNQTYINVEPKIPVYIAYFTAWVDNKGRLNFRNDLYHLDAKMGEEIFGKVGMVE